MKRVLIVLAIIGVTSVCLAAKVVVFDPDNRIVPNCVVQYAPSVGDLTRLPPNVLIYQSPFSDDVPLTKRWDGTVPDGHPSTWKIVGNGVVKLTPQELEALRLARQPPASQPTGEPLVPEHVTLPENAVSFLAISDVMVITGDNARNRIDQIRNPVASRLTLIFTDGNVIISDDESGGQFTVNLSQSFTSADQRTLDLVFDGTSWFEVGRARN